jgi:hypothetical protein
LRIYGKACSKKSKCYNYPVHLNDLINVNKASIII